jgi:hypothetical protein
VFCKVFKPRCDRVELSHWFDEVHFIIGSRDCLHLFAIYQILSDHTLGGVKNNEIDFFGACM